MNTERQYLARPMRPLAPNRNSNSSSIVLSHADAPADPAHGHMSLRGGSWFKQGQSCPDAGNERRGDGNFGTVSIGWVVWCIGQNICLGENSGSPKFYGRLRRVCHCPRSQGTRSVKSGPLTKMVFPFSAGGGGDTLCRLVAQYAGQLLDRSMIVENRTGGDGLIGIKWVRNASPDGATILVTTGPTMYLLPMVEAEPSFEPSKDFVPVSLLARFEFGVVAGRRSMQGISRHLWPGSRPIRATRHLACRATGPFRISPAPSSKRCSAFP